MVTRPLDRKVVVRFNKLLARKKAIFRQSRGVSVPDKALAENLAMHYVDMWFSKVFFRLKNIDHRAEAIAKQYRGAKYKSYLEQKRPTNGLSVREINVARNYPEIGKVVIKIDDETGTAHKTIAAVQGLVRSHNASRAEVTDPFLLREPFAYPLGKKYILMSKTKFPSLHEILGKENNGEGITQRGRAQFENLKREHGFTEAQLRAAADMVYSRTMLPHRNLLLIGYADGKFIFTPLADIS